MSDEMEGMIAVAKKMDPKSVPRALRAYRCPACGSALLKRLYGSSVPNSVRVSCSECKWTGEKDELNPAPTETKGPKSIRLGPIIHGLGLAKFPAAMEREARLVCDFYKMLLELLRKKQKRDTIYELPPLGVSRCQAAAECYRHYRFCAMELRENWKTLKSTERHGLSKAMVDYAAKCQTTIYQTGLSAVMDRVTDDMDYGDEADDE